MNHSARSTPRKGSTRAPPLRIKRRAQSPDTKQSLLPDKRLLLVLISLRMLNALTIKTFFQPDEYYQSLEPAWKSVFGYGELTWEWKEGIRGFLYPSIFASLWWILKTLGVTNPYILIGAAKCLQGVIAAFCDLWTYQLAKRLFNSNVARWTLFSTITSPWNWFTLTRTFSNSIETTLTAGAFLYWPWPSLSSLPSNTSSLRLSLSLFFASLAVLLRPTSIITFLLLLPQSLFPQLILHAIIIGPTTLLTLLVLDTWYFGRPTLPMWNFLKFNLLEELSVFYGRMPWHYYFSQGLPILLTIYLPFALYGLWSFGVVSIYTFVIAGVVGMFSMIKHKEVRFISPLSPLLLVFAGYSISRLPRRMKRIILPGIVLVNMVMAYYLTRVHQSGVISVMHYLRDDVPRNGSVGFLMPCYSTPWQVYLQRPDIDAWKLSCDPPLTLSREERVGYLDQADRFYADPEGFIVRQLLPRLPQRLVFFNTLRPNLDIIQDKYRECARFFNSRIHDDWRRRGDVVVWCLKDKD